MKLGRFTFSHCTMLWFDYLSVIGCVRIEVRQIGYHSIISMEHYMYNSKYAGSCQVLDQAVNLGLRITSSERL